MSPLSGSNAEQPDAGPSSLDGRRRNKQPQLSCAECRRLKLKCDREVPCSNCVRRKCADLCPNGVKETKRQGLDLKAAENLQKRLATLETLLAEQGVDVPVVDETAPRRDKRRRESTSSLDGTERGSQQELRHAQNRFPSSYQAIRPRSPSSTPLSRHPPLSSAREYTIPAHSSPLSHPPAHTARPSSAEGVLQRHSSEHAYWGRNTPPGFARPAGSPGNMNLVDSASRSPVQHSHGTLVIGQSGRSRYLGPTAGTEWLKNQEMGNGDQSPLNQTPSPELRPAEESKTERDRRQATEHLLAFPFPLPAGSSTIEALLSHLPSRDDAEVLMDSYYRYFAWNHDTAPRRFFQPIFDKIFEANKTKTYRDVHPQQLALLYAILAMGTLQNLELPPHDPSADEYLALAKGCLTKGDFLNHNTIAGVQTLIIMAHYLLETEKGRDGDSAWPLWGLAMRIIVAMGLHRDGARWNLPADVVEERRQVFWAAYAIEILQANCFSRPTSLAPQYIDTALPVGPSDHETDSKSYQTLRFELIQLSARILDTGMSVHFESYDTILSLHAQLCSFERSVPFELRCRTALLALPSEYPDPDVARRDSPEITRRNIRRTFQQFTLALNISEHVLFLHRPYFVMAMHDQPVDPTKSVYGRSYLAVVERCSVMIQIVSGLYEVHPAVSSRQWFLWYHIFTAAVCLGTMVLRNPSSVLAQFAITSIDQSIAVYSALIKQNNSPSMVQNHDWLLRLRYRAYNKAISAAQALPRPVDSGLRETEASGRSGSQGDDQAHDGEILGEEEGDLDIVGWKTRLIESAANGSQIAINISHNPTSKGLEPPNLPSTHADSLPKAMGTNYNYNYNNTGVVPAVQQVLQQHLVGPGSGSAPAGGTQLMSMHDVGANPPSILGADSSTDLLLHQFWDPMMMPDAANLAAANWWSWDMGLNNHAQSPTQAQAQAQAQAQHHQHSHGQGHIQSGPFHPH